MERGNTPNHNKLYKLCVEALTTDGAHHKQWYLERILEELGGDVETLREALEREGSSRLEEGVEP